MRAAARRLRAAWALLAGSGGAAAIGFGVLVACCVFLAVAAPRESLGLRTRALQRELSAASPLQRSVTGSIDYSGYASGFAGPPGAADLAATRAQLAAALARDHLPLAANGTGWAGLSTGFVPVTGLLPALAAGGLPPQLELVYRDDLTRYASLAAGRLPAAALPSRDGTVLQAAVTAATAARFGLRPGSRITAGPGTVIVVTGVVRPVMPGSAFWEADPVAAAPAMIQKNPNFPAYWTGAAFVAPAALGLLPRSFSPAAMSLSWGFPLALGSVTADRAASLDDALVRAETQPVVPSGGPAAVQGGPEPVTILSGITTVLGGFVAQDRATGQVLDLLSVSLAVIAAVVILLGAQLAAERRRGEFTVRRARGASAGELALLALRTGAAVTLPAAAAGGALAAGLTPGDTEPLAWLLPALTVAVALAGVPLITMWQQRRPDPAAGTAGEPAGRRPAGRRLAAELALVAAAVGGIVVLRQNGQPSAGGGAVYPSMAPVLVAVPAAILVMHVYPPVLRALRRVARIRPGVTGFVGFTRAADAPPAAVLPVFALVLALSVAAFGFMVRSAVTGGQTAASWQRTGADAIIDASASSQAIDPAARHAIAAVPGVRHVADIIVEAGSAAGTALTVAAVDPSRYAALIAATPDPAFPAASLARPAHGPVPALASPAAAHLLGRGSALGIGTGQIAIRLAGTVSGLPGLGGGAFVVIPQWALGASPPPPTILLAVGPHLDGPRLQAAVRRDLPGATVTLRSAVLASLAAAPLPRGAYLAIAAGTLAAAGLSALIILAAVVLGAPARELALTRLRVLGLTSRQANWLVAAEVLPQVVAGAVGGIACAAAMAPLLAPAIDLSVFTGEPAAAALRPQPAVLAAAAAGLLVLGALMLAAEIAAAGRGGIARAIREHET